MTLDTGLTSPPTMTFKYAFLLLIFFLFLFLFSSYPVPSCLPSSLVASHSCSFFHFLIPLLCPFSRSHPSPSCSLSHPFSSVTPSQEWNGILATSTSKTKQPPTSNSPQQETVPRSVVSLSQKTTPRLLNKKSLLTLFFVLL
jgi:hypothetical protein